MTGVLARTMNDFFENGIISEIDNKIINYLRELKSFGYADIYMMGLTSCSNRKEQEEFTAQFFRTNFYLFDLLPEDLKNYVILINL